MSQRFTAERAELERVLSDARFAKAPALSRLLRFIVDHTLDGRGDSLKEYQLGVDVFDRGPAFDPRVDPIVRVQARALRQRLESYYAVEGQNDPIVIELPKGSYVPRFRQPQVDDDPDRSRASAPVLTRRRGAWAVSLGAATLTIALLISVRVLRDTPPTADVTSATHSAQTVAVIPFANAGLAPGDEYLTHGLTDEITGALRKLRGVRVVPLSHDATNGLIDLGELRARLGVSSVVEGDVREAGTHLRIAAKVVRSADGKALWTETFEGDRSSLFEFQVRIAAAIAAVLAVEVDPAVKQRTESSPVIDAEAHLRYLRARHFAAKRTRDGMLRAIELFESAIERDPRYALAYAGLSEAQALGIWYVPLPPVPARAAAKRAALTAVKIDPTLAEAHTALAEAYSADWQWIESLRSFERAIQLDRSYARAHHAHAYVLAVTGRREQAVDAIRQALRLDPLSVPINADVADILYHAGRDEEAIAQARSALKLDPDFAPTYWALGRALRRRGDDASAVSAFIKEKALRGETTATLNALERAFARDGWQGYWRTEIAHAQRRHDAEPVYEIGRLYGWLGERDHAFAWLERAYAEHNTMLMNIGLDLRAELGSDPRYEQLASRIGLIAAARTVADHDAGAQ